MWIHLDDFCQYFSFTKTSVVFPGASAPPAVFRISQQREQGEETQGNGGGRRNIPGGGWKLPGGGPEAEGA